jgi:hypothetical protein
MQNRKSIRISLTPDDEADFKEAKKAVEAQTGIAMSDSMFALSVIRRDLAARKAIGKMIDGS